YADFALSVWCPERPGSNSRSRLCGIRRGETRRSPSLSPSAPSACATSRPPSTQPATSPPNRSEQLAPSLIQQFHSIFFVALIRKGSKRHPFPPPLLMVVCHDAARGFSWHRMSWLDIGAPKFHLPRITSTGLTTRWKPEPSISSSSHSGEASGS